MPLLSLSLSLSAVFTTDFLTRAYCVLQICVVIAAILGVIVYRIIIVVLIYRGESALLRKQARLITSVTAACLSVLAITILNKLYEKVAIFLTNMGTRTLSQHSVCESVR